MHCVPAYVVKATAQEKKIFKRFAVIHSGLHWRLAETMEIKKKSNQICGLLRTEKTVQTSRSHVSVPSCSIVPAVRVIICDKRQINTKSNKEIALHVWTLSSLLLDLQRLHFSMIETHNLPITSSQWLQPTKIFFLAAKYKASTCPTLIKNSFSHDA